MNAEELRVFVDRSRKASGVPERLEDEATADLVARLLLTNDNPKERA